jgi:hypothetical protein
MEFKKKYALNHSIRADQSLYLNKRLFNTYNKITQKKLGTTLSGINVDFGCGDKDFTEYFKTIAIISCPYDYSYFDIEKRSIKTQR